MRTFAKIFLATILTLNLILGLACSGDPIGGGDGTTDSSGNISLQGAGASFPKPIYEKWVNEYQKINPKIRIDYQSKGSGGGQKDIIAEIVNFGASDDPMKDEDMEKAKGEILHIPTVLGAVVMTYNLEGVDKPLNLTPEVIAAIYLGDIKKWNDPKIAADNGDVKLPDAEILPIYRNDSSGTTAVFTDYLAKTVPAFKEKIGASKQPNWVKGVGAGAPRNDGVMGQVKQTPNTIGYVEIAFAKANKLPTALIKNKAGNFVDATIDNVSAAAAGSIKDMPEDMRVKITNAEGDNTYPISSYTYILVYKQQKDAVKGKALVDFLWWAVHDGSQYAKALHYAPLPKEVVEKVEAKIYSITADGKPLREKAKAAGE
ncbi:MAG: phosphate ABC transporter substrate-binding protein PstS [Pyrinomonadaceae bacterium]|nr:phosphate ABC transporter substrate-binding protein PstS [Pyrinomonadaceae bacterium]